MQKTFGRHFRREVMLHKLCPRFMQMAHQKLHALARLSSYIDPIRLKLLMNAFIKSQFN